jgi:hypothetical protein
MHDSSLFEHRRPVSIVSEESGTWSFDPHDKNPFCANLAAQPPKHRLGGAEQ